MSDYRITGIPGALADEARTTRRSPGFGHPIHEEVATGTGPCRSCLGSFKVGEEQRLLMTYRPDFGRRTLGVPGPVFIHSRTCPRYDGSTLPPELLELPLLVEGRTEDGRTLRSERAPGERADDLIRDYLGVGDIDFVALRHGEAGCFIARVDRA